MVTQYTSYSSIHKAVMQTLLLQRLHTVGVQCVNIAFFQFNTHVGYKVSE